ncbi:putative nuclease HARBI1 [Prorops nasuta]|uniref:putative nuclease HARBI1 n=1 Tax=Prorops nasuta TaxID=863751 RepID=UPI0034CE2BD6
MALNNSIISIIFGDDEEEDAVIPIQRREDHIRIENYFLYIACNYSLSDFKSHFRLKRETFEILLQQIGGELLRKHHAPKVDPAKQLAITLWVFGNQEVYRSVADRFGLSKSTVWECVFNVAYVLEEHVGNYIKWPERQELLHNQRQFQAISNFPGVIGAIDGCHIKISAPSYHPNSYINRKGFHSIILQGICNANLKFIHVFAGFCGSVHDARVWNESDIKRLIETEKNRYFPENSHLLGDSAYPLSTYLLVPYRDNGHLNELQINYNTKLSSTRIVIERTFGMLKGRFRKLRNIYMFNTEMIPLVIMTCCILHNICIDVGDDPIDFAVSEEIEDNNDFYGDEDVILDANMKRDIIANLIN